MGRPIRIATQSEPADVPSGISSPRSASLWISHIPASTLGSSSRYANWGSPTHVPQRAAVPPRSRRGATPCRAV